MVRLRRFSYFLHATYMSCVKKWTVGGSQATKLLQDFINQTLLLKSNRKVVYFSILKNSFYT